MTHLRIIQTAVRSAVCILLTLWILSGCSPDGTNPDILTGYARTDASYTAEFPAGDGTVTGECRRTGTVTVLHVTSPEGLNGLTVTYDSAAGTCSVAVGTMSVPLSPETAAGLTGVFDLLARTADEGGVPSKSADGEYTVISFSGNGGGSVTVAADAAGNSIPAEVTLGGRTIRIGNFRTG